MVVGTVVDVVVELLEDELVLDDVVVVDVVEEVLVLDDVLLVLDVLVLVDVVDDVVVVVPPFSQFVPVMPAGQMHTYAPASVARHVPPFRHGLLGRHGFAGKVVVVVVPAVHTAEPGGALVPGGQEVHAVAAPVENVFAGHARHADAPAAAA